jgi:hypothetical protein
LTTEAKEPAGDYAFLCGNGKENHELGTGFFVNRNESGEFVSGRMSYVILRG